MIEIKISPSKTIEEWGVALSATEQQIKTATTRALNKTAIWARTRVARETSEILEIRVGLVREGLILIKARQSSPEATIGLSKKAGAIKAAKLGKVSQNKTGVRVAKRQFDRAFPTTVQNSHFGAFRRTGKTRLPIQEVFIVITGKMAQVLEKLDNGPALRQFEIVFERELRSLTRNF